MKTSSVRVLPSNDLPEGESFGLEATEYYDPPVASITNAAHVAQVSIDPVTGLVIVDKYVVAHDCGRVINPVTLRAVSKVLARVA